MPAGCSAVGDDPVGGGGRLLQRVGVAGGGVEGDQGLDRPAVFAGVDVLVDARDAFLAAGGVVEREVLAAVFAGDEVGVLAGVERAGRGGEKVRQEAVQILGGFQVGGIAEHDVGARRTLRMSSAW